MCDLKMVILSFNLRIQRRIGGPFTRTSQAFARFNPEIRKGDAELYGA